MDAHLVATRLDPTVGGVSGFACRILFDATAFASGPIFTLPPSGMNVVAPPEFQVGLEAPLPPAPTITLLRMSFVCAGGSALLGVGPYTPCWPGDHIGCIGVAAGNDPGRIMDLTPASSAPYSGVMYGYALAGINAGPTCPVATVADSWGAVKGLYGR